MSRVHNKPNPCSCENSNVRVEHPEPDEYFVTCRGCSDEGPSEFTRERAIAAWNQRTPPTPAGDELAEWDDPHVQAVYQILVSGDAPPNPEEHWEGWTARRIVAALSRLTTPSTTGNEQIITPVGEPCRLDECPPGPFLFDGRLGFRSEYWTSSIKPDAYCMDSGEYFWGGTDSTMKRAALIVQPVELAALTTPVIPNGASVEDAGQGSTSVESADATRGGEKLREAAQGLLARMSSTYTARNGRQVGIQGDDGEKCWIVHSDDITALEAALASPVEDATDAGSTLNEQTVELRELLRQTFNALACADKNDPLECIADNGMTVWDGMRNEAERLKPHVLAALQHLPDHPKDDRLRDAAIALALAAGKLNVALDGQEKYRSHRTAVVEAMDAVRTALENKLMKGGGND